MGMSKQAVRAGNSAEASAGRRIRFFTATALATGMLAGLASPAVAEDDTWTAPPEVNGDWDDGANWNTNTVPDATDDVAVFNTGHLLTLSTNKVIDGIRYDAGADSGTINVAGNLGLVGSGIVNNSGNFQTIRIVGSGNSVQFGNSTNVLGGPVTFDVGDRERSSSPACRTPTPGFLSRRGCRDPLRGWRRHLSA
jgi:hypothetical protein